MKQILFLFTATCGLSFLHAQVGIGTATPLARLHVADSSVLFSAPGTAILSAGNTPVSGAGRRMMWYADKAAFRAGYASADQWDRDSIGQYSTSFGYSTVARGSNSTALGINTSASGGGSTAMGEATKASGFISTAMGESTTASGVGSTAMGTFTTASGFASTALGSNVSTNGKEGSFIIGDHTGNFILPDLNDANNQMMMRFAGGYKLYTNGSGVQLLTGGNAWSTLSDINRKENFAPVNGENFLDKIAGFNLVSWNYKGQNAATYRHYGPMAQEFYQAFGKDNYGSIGNDTTINQADFEGINLIAIQTLERRTAKLKKENEELKQRLARLEALFEKHLTETGKQ